VRRCGSCSECCTALRIDMDDGTNKPMYKKCPSDKGGTRCCSIYDTRPKVCRKFECAWLQGMGSQSDKPDELGVIFFLKETELGVTLHIAECFPGAHKKIRALALARGVSEKNDIAAMVIPHGQSGHDGVRHVLRCPESKTGTLMKMNIVRTSDLSK